MFFLFNFTECLGKVAIKKNLPQSSSSHKLFFKRYQERQKIFIMNNNASVNMLKDWKSVTACYMTVRMHPI